MHQAFPSHALADAGLVQHGDRALLEHAGADPALDIVAAAPLEDDASRCPAGAAAAKATDRPGPIRRCRPACACSLPSQCDNSRGTVSAIAGTASSRLTRRISREERHDALEVSPMRGVRREARDDEHVQADRRRDQPELDHHQRQDAEPDLQLLGPEAVGGAVGERIGAAIEIDQHRPEERHDHQDHGERFHEAAENDEDHQHGDQDQPGIEAAGARPGRQRGRQAGAGEEALQHLGAEQDEVDHGWW